MLQFPESVVRFILFTFKVSCKAFNAVKYILLSLRFFDTGIPTRTKRPPTPSKWQFLLLAVSFVIFQRLYKCVPPWGTETHLHQATNVILLSVIASFCVSPHQRASVCIFWEISNVHQDASKNLYALIAWDYTTEIAIWCQLPNLSVKLGSGGNCIVSSWYRTLCARAYFVNICERWMFIKTSVKRF